MKTKTVCIAILILAVFSSAALAEVELPSLFSDGMVVQRESEAKIWGWAEPGEEVEIAASWGEGAQAVADSGGKWSAVLQTPAAGGPFRIRINGKTIEDVLSGEVWLCSGQSNMDCDMRFFTKDARQAKHQPIVLKIREEIKTATDNLFRQIEVPHTVSPEKLLDDFEGAWMSSSPANNGDFTAAGYYFGKELRSRLDVPVGLIKCAWGGTQVQPWIPEAGYRSRPEMEEFYEREIAKAREIAADKDTFRPFKIRQYPTVIFNGMVAPVRPYSIRGVIWYQGESNRRHMWDSYLEYFKTLIESWRREWRQGDFPFYWAQLAAYDEKQYAEEWVSICDQQRRALFLPKTGMAVLNDIGDAGDIHPRNKIDVGKRLALWALARDYGVGVPAYSGPLFEESNVSGEKVVVKFTHCGSGLMTGKKAADKPARETDADLGGFEIRAADGKWLDAEARITSADTVEVFAPAVEKPVAVRYAWNSYPADANLYNKEGLPASLFTTEEP